MQEKKIYFIGIGGIGVSALAQWYLSEGWRVFGSDAKGSAVISFLKRKGAKIRVGKPSASRVKRDFQKVVYSVAVPEGHPERKAAGQLGIPQLTYAKGLGEIAKSYKTIAVSGAHGKSTTTAMAALMLIRAGFDPTVFVGTKLKEFGGSNFRKGKSQWLVVEADEFHGSFLNYRPYAAICTNVDREHLDYYKTFANVKKAFKAFFLRVSSDGVLVLNRDNETLRRLKFKSAGRVVWYTIQCSEARRVKSFLKVPGPHNLSNAMASVAIGKTLGIEASSAHKALSAFRGTWRRFEYRGMWRGALIYDDYAHHPTEITATIQGAREKYPGRAIQVVFQPHLAERLSLLFKDFISALSMADNVIILETYKVLGRDDEKSAGSRGAAALAAAIGKRRPAQYAANHREVLRCLPARVGRGDIIILMGAGDITDLYEKLKSRRN